MYGSPPNAREGSWRSLMHRPIHPPIDVDCAIRFPNTNSFSLCSPWYNPEYETQNDLRDQSDARLTTGLGLSETSHQTHQTKLMINHLTVISLSRFRRCTATGRESGLSGGRKRDGSRIFECGNTCYGGPKMAEASLAINSRWLDERLDHHQFLDTCIRAS